MKAVILAAGEGKRLIPFSLTRPKPLIPILDKPFLEYTLENLVGLVDEVVLVINEKYKEKWEEFKGKFNKMRIKFVFQEKPVGTGDALKYAEKYVNDEDFLVIYGDVYTEREDLRKIILEERNVIAAFEVEDPTKYGVLTVKDGYLDKIIEKPEKPTCNLVNAGIYKFGSDIFSYLEKIKLSKRGEYELTDAVTLLAKEKKVKVVKLSVWKELGNILDIFELNKFFFEKRYNILIKNNKELGYERIGNYFVKGDVSGYVVLKGRGIIEEDSAIYGFSYLNGEIYIGKNSEIGPLARIRGNSYIYSNCRIGNFVEIKSSVIFKNTKIFHLSYVGDSILGENANLGAGTIIANLRFDERPIKIILKDKIFDTGRRKLGAFLGDNVKTGINVSIMPGTIIYPNIRLMPGKVYKDVVKE